jgi:hypothetical protein
MAIVFGLPFCFAVLHIFEEFAWPRGFAAWYATYRPYVAGSLTTRFFVVGNGLLLLVAFFAWLDGSFMVLRTFPLVDFSSLAGREHHLPCA